MNKGETAELVGRAIGMAFIAMCAVCVFKPAELGIPVALASLAFYLAQARAIVRAQYLLSEQAKLIDWAAEIIDNVPNSEMVRIEREMHERRTVDDTT